MHHSSTPTRQRSRGSPGTLQGKADPAEQASGAGTGSSRRCLSDVSCSVPPSSAPQASGTTQETRTHAPPSDSVIQSGKGFSYLRASTTAPESPPSAARRDKGQGRRTAPWSQAPVTRSSPRASREDTYARPSAHPPSAHDPLSSSLHSSTPAESSLARLRALAGLAPLHMPSHDSQVLSPLLYRNEESPPRHLRTARTEIGGSGASSASSSCASSPYTPDLAQRLSFLNGTSAQATMAVLERDRRRLSRRDSLTPSSPSAAPIFQNEEEVVIGQQCRGPSAALTVNITASPASGDPFLTPSLGLASLRASASALYRNEEDAAGNHCAGAESGSALPTTSLLSRLRAANASLSSGAESGGKKNFFIPPKDGVAGVSGAPAPHERPAGSRRKSVGTPLGPTLLAEPFPPPGPGLLQASDISARLTQLRQRASTSPASLSSIETIETSVASCTETAQKPQPSFFTSLSRLRRLENLQRQQEQWLTPWLSARLRGNPDLASPSPAPTMEAALKRTPRHGLLTRATAAPAPPAATESVVPDLDPTDAHERDARRQRLEDVLSSSASGKEQSSEHAPAKMGARRAPSRKCAVPTAAKKERTAAAVSRTSRLQKATRGSTAHASTVTLSASPKVTVAAAAGGGALRGTRSPVKAKQLMHKLRSMAAPVPVGETVGKSGPVDVSNPFLASVAAPLAHSPREELAQRPSALPPSWSTTAPFAALASPSLHAALTQASTELLKVRRSPGSTMDTNGATDDDSRGSEPPSSSFASVSPCYTYPSMMTRSATAAAAAALVAAATATARPTSPVATVATASTAGTTDLTSRARMRTASTNSRKSGSDTSDMKCFVFDTSSLLDSEPGVMSLVLEKWLLGIPFTVLDELDRMHKDRGCGVGIGKSDHVATAGANGTHDREWRRQRAHELRNWIAACLSDASKSHLLLQKRTEVVEEYDRHATTNDDRILGYAVYLTQHQAAKVLFVSEDKFLRIKASSELGKAYTYSEVRKFVGMPPLPTASPTELRRKGNK
ncbi:hypothetical protein LSCM1_05964 [Leishmania martiniquensis]|uniref:PIN domain-containing protein n=1 Tax=Leishmania martiniquensis TaxID=1580590 RepID=A0A836H1J7_9TRYP|nr:hypothetical protein LSCM1_05964 [Leishmania martiniquensis]